VREKGTQDRKLAALIESDMEVAEEVLAPQQPNMHRAEACTQLNVDPGDARLQG
jgi:hypothetical protein